MYALASGLEGPLGRGNHATVWGATRVQPSNVDGEDGGEQRGEGGRGSLPPGSPSCCASTGTCGETGGGSSELPPSCACTLVLKRRFRQTSSAGLVESREVAFYRSVENLHGAVAHPHLLRLENVLYTWPVGLTGVGDSLKSPAPTRGVDETLVLVPALAGTAREWAERRWFSRGLRVPLSWVGLVMHGVMCALAEVHRLGWVHRGVTLDNVLLSADTNPPRIVLGGFGHVHSAGEAADVSLTPAHARSPEALTGQAKQAEPAQDIWAAGTILGHLLLGRPVFLHDAVGRAAPGAEIADDLRVLEGIVRAVGLDCGPLLSAAASKSSVARDASRPDGPSALVRPSHSLDRLLTPSHAKTLLLNMLSSDPAVRPTADACLESPFLCNWSHEKPKEREALIARLIR